MPFFEPIPPPEPQRRRRRRRRRDRSEEAWEAPALVVPVYLPEPLLLAESKEMAVAIHGFACYPVGFGFHLQVTSRYLPHEDEHGHHDVGWFGRSASDDTSPRLGIAYSDGRRGELGPGASEHPWFLDPEPDGISISPGGGGGGGGHWVSEVFVRPLPPPGPVTFAVEWTAQGIDETLVTIDGERFIDAAAASRPLFT